MSIYPTQSHHSDSSKHIITEKEEEIIPQAVVENARGMAERFFEREQPYVQRSVKDWAIEILLPGMIQIEEAKAAVSQEEVELFPKTTLDEVVFMIAELEKINFSREHHLDTYSYPSLEAFQPIAAWLSSSKEKYTLYKRQDGFASEFKQSFRPFLEALRNRIKKAALNSRHFQYEQILLRPEDPDFEIKKATTLHHIYALENNHKQPLLELRDLLNLGRNPKINRHPSMQEQEAFRFLLTMDEEISTMPN